MHDHFMDLGGHSLSAMRLISTSYARTKASNLSVADILDNPTIAKLAERIEALADYREQNEVSCHTCRS